MKTLIAAILLLAFTACSTNKKVTSSAQNVSLSTTWSLKKLGNTTIKVDEQGRGIPTLALKLSESKAFGNGGCNRFSGSIKIEGNKITFSPLISTKMACPQLNVENRYLNLLSGQSLPYRLSEGMLYLGEGDSELVFAKGD